MTHSFMTTSPLVPGEAGTNIHYVEQKPEDPQQLLILLHGFPQFWYAWKSYISEFAARGFHVIAPDMRGYNKSDKPKKKSAYDIKFLIHDVLELIRHCGYEKAVLMGHDWGGIIIWELAEHHPDKVEAAIVINAPHRGAAADALRKNHRLRFRQMLRSWYIFFFQLPFLPERFLQLGDFKWLNYGFRKLSNTKDAFSDEDIDAYKKALQKPGALTATINYYRANIRGKYGREFAKAYKGNYNFGIIDIPTLVVWGDQDAALDFCLTKHLQDYMVNTYKEVHFKDASHWVLHEHSSRILQEVGEFLQVIP